MATKTRTARGPYKGRKLTRKEKELATALNASSNRSIALQLRIDELTKQMAKEAEAAGVALKRAVAIEHGFGLSRCKRLMAIAVPEAADVILQASDYPSLHLILETTQAVITSLEIEAEEMTRRAETPAPKFDFFKSLLSLGRPSEVGTRKDGPCDGKCGLVCRHTGDSSGASVKAD